VYCCIVIILNLRVYKYIGQIISHHFIRWQFSKTSNKTCSTQKCKLFISYPIFICIYYVIISILYDSNNLIIKTYFLKPVNVYCIRSKQLNNNCRKTTFKIIIRLFTTDCNIMSAYTCIQVILSVRILYTCCINTFTK